MTPPRRPSLVTTAAPTLAVSPTSSVEIQDFFGSDGSPLAIGIVDSGSTALRAFSGAAPQAEETTVAIEIMPLDSMKK